MKMPKEFIDNINMITDEAARRLMELGVEVVRAGEIDHSKEYEIDGVKTKGSHSYNARDELFYYDNFAIEVPSPFVSRQYESEAYYWILE